MSLAVNVAVSDSATPALHALHEALTDKSELHAYMASSGEAGTRQYLRGIAPHTHTTAERLGASPTNYLLKRAELTESSHSADKATVTVNGAIFQRALGPVTVTARRSKWLTIPGTAEAYGKSAREFNDLRVQFFGKGLMGLVKAEQSNVGTRARAGFDTERNTRRPPLLNAGRGDVYFWLKKSVVLPHDRTLLPDELAYAQWAEIAARAYLRKVVRERGL